MNLFDMTPEALQQQRAAALDTQAQAYAQQGAQQRADAAGYQFGNALGRGAGSLLGVEDKELLKVKDIQGMMKGIDVNDPEALLNLSKQLGSKGYMTEGEMAWKKAKELETAMGTAAKAKTEAAKSALSLSQEEKLRKELSSLPADATDEDFLAVVRKYGKPDEVMKSIENKQAKVAAADAKIEAAKVAAAAALERAREQGATAIQLKQMSVDSAKAIASMTAALKGPAASKPLAPSLQKSEDADLEKVNSLEAQATALEPAIKAVTKDPKTGKAPLELGPINNTMYAASNLQGKSTPASKAYAELQRAVTAATNLKVSAEKGVQTDKDVLRFANELTAAFGNNDTEVTLKALENFNKAVNTAKDKTKGIIQSRRKSQNVESYDFGETPKPETPKATKRFNPATGQIEAI